jgi:hypothetical protein
LSVASTVSEKCLFDDSGEAKAGLDETKLSRATSGYVC